MATVMTSARRTVRLSRPYALIGVLCLAIAIVGFWATYYGPLLAGRARTAAIIQLHAAIFVGWLLLVIAQAVFAARGQIALHRRLGNYGMAYGVLVVAIAVVGTLWAFETRLRAGDVRAAHTSLFIGLTDILTFVPFLAAAWFYRRQPEVHKRLIVVATTVLLIAPVHRMHWFLGRPAPVMAVLLIWLAPIYLAMIHDFIARRKVHPVYLIGILAVIYMKFWRVPMRESDTWNAIAAWFTALYG
jgi:hypothetical protein